MRLLLIEDDAALRLTLARQLEADGYRVDQARDGEEGLFLAREYPVDLVIVDLGLPKLNGLTIVQRLRQEGSALPILILTARGSWQDKVVGLEAGADDYLVKPFEYPELAARLKALLRRSVGASSDVLTLGPLSIDLSTQAVRLGGTMLELTAFEYRYSSIWCDSVRPSSPGRRCRTICTRTEKTATAMCWRCWWAG